MLWLTGGTTLRLGKRNGQIDPDCSRPMSPCPVLSLHMDSPGRGMLLAFGKQPVRWIRLAWESFFCRGNSLLYCHPCYFAGGCRKLRRGKVCTRAALACFLLSLHNSTSCYRTSRTVLQHPNCRIRARFVVPRALVQCTVT